MSWEETTGSQEQDKFFIAGLCESEETLSFIDSLVLTPGEGCLELSSDSSGNFQNNFATSLKLFFRKE